ncbi:hypothetical protein Glove_217g85 [Diversispora epigaea]|uniref:RNase H type-1 domain-containing protein n=1 Tax=Diversispora epigaea TaxID=1348612 RepID=A0A397IR41_9GLOM|nr:hypothetical protein Glove_217g85 [Diversispora epigaea]
MSFGWVINYERLTFRDNIKNFLSLMRAKLMGIFTALIVMPTKEIWTKNKNPVILQMINNIVKEKKLKIICYKVKAHSRDKYNEITDSLAKIPEFIEGITNNFFKDTTISLKEINWDLTFKTKHPSKITSDITNKEDSNIRSFALKLLCEELSTLSKRYVHKSNLYSSSSCILYDGSVEEDNMHEKSNIDIKIIKKVINKIDILNYSYEKDYMLSKNYSDLTFFDVIKGFIPNILVTKVKKICKNKKAKEIKNGITNKDKRMKQIRNEMGTRISVDKVPNMRKGNLHTSKTIVEKVNFKIPKLNNLDNNRLDIKSSIAYFSQFK